jgi:predicted nucleic acid-binding Zn ribbon protein
MPLFDYKCPHCGETREVLLTSWQVEPVLHCEFRWCSGVECNGILERQHSTATIRIKGFSAVNGYSRTDTGYQPSGIPGIKTRVSDGSDK